MRISRFLFAPGPMLAVGGLLLSGCAASRQTTGVESGGAQDVIPAAVIVPAELAQRLQDMEAPRDPGSRDAVDIPPSAENIHATLWTASAVEYRALARQTYRLARVRLDEALADTSWSAALEQGPGAGGLPPAIVLDVDETVLDNTTYQARLIEAGEYYGSESWNGWVEEGSAIAVPGAVEFTRYAASRGVQVVYMTNRDASGESATRRNLAAEGFPLSDAEDDVITKGERPEWASSDKGARRAHVASSYRVLLLVGDNLGDFLSDGRADLEGRDRLYAEHDAWWGTRWIVLPNSQYGSWESAAFDNDHSLPPSERMERKQALIRRRADG